MHKVYKHLKSVSPKGFNFLFPDNTFSPEYYTSSLLEPKYANWLIAIFDQWIAEEDAPSISLFREIIQLLFSGNSNSSIVGQSQKEFVVIETDGGIEASDSLKSCGQNFTKTGLNVNTHELDLVASDRLIKLDINAHTELCEQCKQCPIVDYCGGGFLVNRYTKENGFDNPSLYCRDLTKLIVHIHNTVLTTIEEEYREGWMKLDWEDIVEQQALISELNISNIELSGFLTHHINCSEI